MIKMEVLNDTIVTDAEAKAMLEKRSKERDLKFEQQNAFDTLNKFRPAYERRLKSLDYEPAFDLDAALSQARQMTGRDDAGGLVAPLPFAVGPAMNDRVRHRSRHFEPSKRRIRRMRQIARNAAHALGALHLIQ